jgi:hypothetical protein
MPAIMRDKSEPRDWISVPVDDRVVDGFGGKVIPGGSEISLEADEVSVVRGVVYWCLNGHQCSILCWGQVQSKKLW